MKAKRIIQMVIVFAALMFFYNTNVYAQEIKPELNTVKFLILEDFVGTFFIKELSSNIEIVKEDWNLYAKPEGKSRGELFYKGSDTFYNDENLVVIKFIRNEGKKVFRLIVYQDGNEFSGEREIKK